MFGRGRHDSRLAMAHDACADSSCLEVKDVKSLRFVVLVFLGRDGCKAATKPLLGVSPSEERWRLMHRLQQNVPVAVNKT